MCSSLHYVRRRPSRGSMMRPDSSVHRVSHLRHRTRSIPGSVRRPATITAVAGSAGSRYRSLGSPQAFRPLISHRPQLPRRENVVDRQCGAAEGDPGLIRTALIAHGPTFRLCQARFHERMFVLPVREPQRLLRRVPGAGSGGRRRASTAKEAPTPGVAASSYGLSLPRGGAI